MKIVGLLVVMICSAQLSLAQCTWTSVFYDSYEYTTVIPHIIPGTTYQNTSQTFAGCVRTGARGMYLNIVDGFSGIVYSQPFQDLCIGQNYRFTFSTRDAFSSTNNLTFNVYDNNSNALLATQTVITNSSWNDVVMPSFTTTATTIRFEIVSNTPGGPGNDAGFDDLRLQQCQPDPINHTVTKCIGTPDFNLYNEQAGIILGQSGIWTGPAALQNGYLGTFNTAVNPNGTYTYTIDGAIGCADSISNFQVQGNFESGHHGYYRNQCVSKHHFTGNNRKQTSLPTPLILPEPTEQVPPTIRGLPSPLRKHFMLTMVYRVVPIRNRLLSPFHNQIRQETMKTSVIALL